MQRRILMLVLVTLLMGTVMLPTHAQETATTACVDNYDPTVDYFPAKSTVEYATGLEIEYFNNYKVVHNTRPWPGATTGFEYVLVQCGTPAPEGFEDAQIIEVPVDSVISMSTSQLPQLQSLGLLDHLIGVDSLAYPYNDAVREMIAADQLIEIGSGTSVNVELTLDAEPTLVFANGSGVAEWDAYPILLDAGIPVVLNGDWAETTPLGRAEWIKFMGAFYNQEATANAVFEDIATNYEALAALAADLPAETKPTVLPNTFSTWDEAWNMPGGDSYVAQLLKDAGANIILSDAPEVQGQVGSVPFSFEVVYEAGLDADLWITNDFDLPDLAALIAHDERYGDFAAVKNGTIYNTDARVNENGGNDYWETGVSNPQLILADLIAVLHPELLPDHEMMFYRQLQ